MRSNADHRSDEHRRATPDALPGRERLRALAIPAALPGRQPGRGVRLRRGHVALLPRRDRAVRVPLPQLLRWLAQLAEQPAQHPPHPVREIRVARQPHRQPETETAPLDLTRGVLARGVAHREPVLSSRQLPGHRSLGALGQRRRARRAHPLQRQDVTQRLVRPGHVRHLTIQLIAVPQLLHRRHHPRRRPTSLRLVHAVSVRASADTPTSYRHTSDRWVRQMTHLASDQRAGRVPLTRWPNCSPSRRRLQGEPARGPLPPSAAPHRTVAARPPSGWPWTHRHSEDPGHVSGEGEGLAQGANNGPEHEPGEPVDADTSVVIGSLTFASVGWHTTADALLANSAAGRAREHRRTPAEELTTQP